MRRKYYLALKYYMETNNQQQITCTYNELDQLNNFFQDFQFYLLLDKELVNFLAPKDKSLNKDLYDNLTQLYKLRLASNIFEQANFNQDLMKEILLKIKPPTPKEEIQIKAFEKKNDMSTSLILFIFLLICFLIIYVQSYLYSVNINKKQTNGNWKMPSSIY